MKKILIFIVAYNAERHIGDVLDRIPKNFWDTTQYDVEVLIIDDASTDNTVNVSHDYAFSKSYPIKILTNPRNQGYGGNQKIGYTYAIEKHFDIVVLLHGDGQYPPEKIEDMIAPILDGSADVVFGSRMMHSGDALRGGMPYYKYVGNKILTTFQNLVLSMSLSEFHSGFRAYSVEKLRAIPLQYNSNDFDFDTDIIIQLNDVGARFREMPIPTRYGNEICRVNGIKYAFQITCSTVLSRVQKYGIFYRRKFDYEAMRIDYETKVAFDSTHRFAIDYIKPNSVVLDIGCWDGHIGKTLIEEKQCEMHGIDRLPTDNVKTFYRSVTTLNLDKDPFVLPAEIKKLDYVLLLDVLEHLESPETFLSNLRTLIAPYHPECIVTTGNVGFCITRFSLLIGQFNYGKRGILDLTHKRLFTFSSFRHLLGEEGYKVTKQKGIPVPIPFIVSNRFIAKILTALNVLGIKCFKGLFSYQIAYIAEPLPTMGMLLHDAKEEGDKHYKQFLSTLHEQT